MKWLLIVLGIVVGSFVFGQLKSPSPKNWQKDLRKLQQELSTRHVNLYHTISKDSFDLAVNDLYDDIPDLTTPEILVRIAQLVALIGDGHTSFQAGNQKRKWFNFYPVQFWAFSDGIYVISADKAHAELIGKRLVQIDHSPIEKAFEAVSTTIAADNDMEYTYTVPFELVRPELLHTLGISKSIDMAEFIFADGVQKTLHAIPLKKWQKLDWRTASRIFEGKKPPSMRVDALFATPLTIDHLRQRKYYWYTYLEEDQTLFLQYNVCWDQKDRPSLGELSSELFQFMDSHPVEKLIIDIKQNSGGEPLIAKSLIDELSTRKKFSEEGRLFVLTGRRTYSAALTNAAQLRYQAGARIVGEHSRGKPNHPSEGRDIDLKQTNIWVTVSTQYVERDSSLGDAPFLPVDIPVEYTFESFKNAEDPFLQAALKAKNKKCE